MLAVYRQYLHYPVCEDERGDREGVRREKRARLLVSQPQSRALGTIHAGPFPLLHHPCHHLNVLSSSPHPLSCPLPRRPCLSSGHFIVHTAYGASLLNPSLRTESNPGRVGATSACPGCAVTEITAAARTVTHATPPPTMRMHRLLFPHLCNGNNRIALQSFYGG